MCRYARVVTPDELADLAHLRRARDVIDQPEQDRRNARVAGRVVLAA